MPRSSWLLQIIESGCGFLICHPTQKGNSFILFSPVGVDDYVPITANNQLADYREKGYNCVHDHEHDETKAADHECVHKIC